MSTPLGDLYEYIFVQIEAIAKPFTEPALEKLLPDWPNGIPGIPPNVPAPPTLVLDLEDTFGLSLILNSHCIEKTRMETCETTRSG